jgi:hypothetical protein
MHNIHPWPILLQASVTPLSLRQLRRIDMSYVLLNDAGLRALMEHLPLLTHVAMRACDLRTSHVDAPCNWEELRLSEHVTTTALARLPLWGIGKLEAWNVCSARDSSDNAINAADDLAAALAAAPGCALSCTLQKLHPLTVACYVDELSVLLPRWQCGGLQRISLLSPTPGAELTPDVVEALGVLLERTPSCKELRIAGFAPPDPESAPLLPALRDTAVNKVCFEYSDMTEAQLLAWCAGTIGGQVGRPIVVRLEHGRLAGRLERVRQAMQESGSLVTLECPRRA